MIDLEKLKREWKTFAIAVVGTIIEVYDALITSGQVELPPLFPEHYRPWVGPLTLVLMLLLRKWKDANVVIPSQ
jgi:hypothetical protein